MLPQNTTQYAGYCRLVNPQSVSNGLLAKPIRTQKSNLLDVIFVEFGVVMGCAMGWFFRRCACATGLAIFCYLVVHVIGRSTEKKVGRPDAGGRIAFVENEKTKRYIPFIDLPGNAMRYQRLAALRAFADLSIPAFIRLAALPHPASSTLLDIKPESIRKRNYARKPEALSTAVDAAAALHKAWAWVKRCSALEAFGCNQWFAHVPSVAQIRMAEVTA